MNKFIIIILTTLAMLVNACSAGKGKIKLEEEVKTRFDKGMYYLGKERYLRAQEEFTYVVISGSHTELGDDAQFYLAESYFLNEEYVQAIADYDQLIRKMPFTPFMQKSRYRICESYVQESLPYYKDQTYTDKALDKLQEFLDDFPATKHKEEATSLIQTLRNKLAKKLYETGVLYIKLDEFSSAIYSFEEIVEKYFETEYIGLAHVGIIKCHSLGKEYKKASDYFSKVEIMLQTLELSEEALGLIEKTDPANEEKSR
ncbi:MAG: outer membrane protein assembly factor BamD [Candidatus Marinimicrobia bacterium]|jgi:outer membrane protein assembly factor BamD|nr:outer membrane protein assembly factor BamD [Candidatus Neomarinimicrobiota bacterium]MBT3618118.1 outer membrane protein assembly factor BamD [Candidatus Neomarinimicrobiota bacterium]MBT3828589.1 outer membrane protein assembly factor BamD [Candidatus Neomarinimicrobiota bacterium]MBT3996949.1 outer membrane protein assembly factor BamD [Candidatus Neomarinimicrobiota bacterium]MBT4280913.1 outer membrane protein assembly factor BamD [Candidatus Neomarinimicrobiota bacterium]